MPTPNEVITYAEISQYISLVDNEKSGLYAGGNDLTLTRKLYMVRKNLSWLYDKDPTDDRLIPIANYLWWLCGKYQAASQNVSGSAGIVAPISGAQGFPIYFTDADFTTSTFYPNTRVSGNNVIIFLNEMNRYLVGSEFTVSATGVTINISGFDATTNTYNLVIEKVYS